MQFWIMGPGERFHSQKDSTEAPLQSRDQASAYDLSSGTGTGFEPGDGRADLRREVFAACQKSDGGESPT